MKQKHHQKINNFYFIYKSPGAMLVTSENTRNDVQGPLKYEKPPKIRRFSYQSATVGLPIVNQSYHADGRALWVTKTMMMQEVDKSSFTNTLTFLMSNDIITIYVPRGFQRIYHNPLILQHVDKAQLLVRLERFCAVSDIRICSSSYTRYTVRPNFI